MKKSLLLGLGGAAILGGWVLKSYLESRGSANAGENSVAANAKNSAQGEKEAFKSELDELSQKQFKCDFGSENSSLSENFTHKEEKMKMRDLEELQDEALQDRAWMSATYGWKSFDSWDGRLIFGETKINDLDELRSNFVPSLLCENLANGKLEKWLENKATLCKNEQKIQAFKGAAEQIKKIAKNSTRLEATRALYEIFHNEKSPKWLDDIFEADIRWNALQAVVDANYDKKIALTKRLETAANYDERQALYDEDIALDDENAMVMSVQDGLDNNVSEPDDNASAQEQLRYTKISLTLVRYHTSRQFKNIQESLPSHTAMLKSSLNDISELGEVDSESLMKALDEIEGR